MLSFFRRAWYVLRRRRSEADLAEEMRFHRDMTAQELERAGRDSADASFAAQRAFVQHDVGHGSISRRLGSGGTA